MNADDVNAIVTSASDGDNNLPVVQSKLNHDTLDVDDTDTRRSNDDDDDDDVITGCNDDKSSLASCSKVAQEQRNDESLNGCFKLAARDRAGFVVEGWFVISSREDTWPIIFAVSCTFFTPRACLENGS